MNNAYNFKYSKRQCRNVYVAEVVELIDFNIYYSGKYFLISKFKLKINTDVTINGNMN